MGDNHLLCRGILRRIALRMWVIGTDQCIPSRRRCTSTTSSGKPRRIVRTPRRATHPTIIASLKTLLEEGRGVEGTNEVVGSALSTSLSQFFMSLVMSFLLLGLWARSLRGHTLLCTRYINSWEGPKLSFVFVFFFLSSFLLRLRACIYTTLPLFYLIRLLSLIVRNARHVH